MSPISLAAIYLQAAGTIVAIVGLLSTGARYGRWMAVVRSAARRTWNAFELWLHRKFGFRRRLRLAGEPMQDRFRASPSRGEGFWSRPDPALSSAELIELLFRRIDGVQSSINELRIAVDEIENTARKDRVDSAEAVGELWTEIQTQVRATALDGLWLAAIGLLITLAGTILSLWG